MQVVRAVTLTHALSVLAQKPLAMHMYRQGIEICSSNCAGDADESRNATQAAGACRASAPNASHLQVVVVTALQRRILHNDARAGVGLQPRGQHLPAPAGRSARCLRQRVSARGSDLATEPKPCQPRPVAEVRNRACGNETAHEPARRDHRSKEWCPIMTMLSASANLVPARCSPCEACRAVAVGSERMRVRTLLSDKERESPSRRRALNRCVCVPRLE